LIPHISVVYEGAIPERRAGKRIRRFKFFVQASAYLKSPFTLFGPVLQKE